MATDDLSHFRMTARGSGNARRGVYWVGAPAYIGFVRERSDLESVLWAFIARSFDDSEAVRWVEGEYLNRHLRVESHGMLWNDTAWGPQPMAQDFVLRSFLHPDATGQCRVDDLLPLLQEFGPLVLPHAFTRKVRVGWDSHSGWRAPSRRSSHLHKVLQRILDPVPGDNGFDPEPVLEDYAELAMDLEGEIGHLRLDLLMGDTWLQYDTYRLYHAVFSCWLRLLQPIPTRWWNAPLADWLRDELHREVMHGGSVAVLSRRGWLENGHARIAEVQEGSDSSLALHRLTDLQAQCPAPIKTLWWARGFPAPETVGDLMETITVTINEAARESGPYVECLIGSGSLGVTAPGLLSVLCQQMIEYIAGTVPVRECERADCGRLFTWQEGRARHNGAVVAGEPTRNQRQRNAKYCSDACAKVMGSRLYRNRKSSA